MQRNSTIRGFSRLERVLLFCGILLVSVYIGSRFYGAVYSRSSLQSFWTSQAAAQTAVEASPRSQSSLPDFRLWSEKRIQKYQASLLVKVPPPLGVIEIPSLGLQVPILEGTDDLTLDRGVGHIAGTASPGESGKHRHRWAIETASSVGLKIFTWETRLISSLNKGTHITAWMKSRSCHPTMSLF